MRFREVRKEVWTILAVSTDRGDCELLDFLEGLGSEYESDAASLGRLFDSVAQGGPPRNVYVSHQLGGKIFEFTRGDLRVLYFTDEGRIVICTHGLLKKTKKTP